MDVHTYTEYEIIDSITNEKLVTQERYVALACYKADDVVYERHVTVHRPTLDTQTYLAITRLWTYNPEFEEE